MHDSLNPYRTPVAPLVVEQSPPCDRGAPITATLVRRRSLYRHIRLSGPFTADIIWKIRFPGESVYVDGVLKTRSYLLSASRSFTFTIESDNAPRKAVVEIHDSMLLGILSIPWVAAFRLRIDDAVVYSEGRWRD